MTRRNLLLALILMLLSAPLFGTRFILEASPAAAPNLAAQYGLTIVSQIPNSDLFLVTAPDTVNISQLITQVSANATVWDFELDTLAATPETSSTIPLAPTTTLDSLAAAASGSSGLTLDQSTAGILDSVSNASVVTYYGNQVPSYYVNQTATSLINLTAAQSHYGAVGAGIVAVIDTGVDPNHVALQGALLPGFDFTRHQSGASEFQDLDQSTAGILDQSTAGILDMNTVVVLNQSTAGILDQSTAGILDASMLPKDFGHGTMVAGIIHLVAPQAKILPLKAFNADGTARIYDIAAAIRYAVDQGANVISMSFDYGQANSLALAKAIRYASSNGVICVASAGNMDSPIAVYPAGNFLAFGIASTTTDPTSDLQSAFTNYGAWVSLAAPGEAIRTTYPGNHYAVAWGTSFSAPFVSGTVALLYQFYGTLNQYSTAVALQNAVWINPNLGWGRLDVYQAVGTYAQPASTQPGPLPW
jgi:subtilisin family serine protease